jgi:CRP-like cAMP-binding protein
MSPAAFRRLLAQEPILAERVMRHLAGLVRRLSERVIDLSTLGVQNRIHAEILRLAREAGISPGLTQFLPRITAQAATSKARRTNSGLKPCRCASGAPCPGCACAAPVRKDRIKASRIFVSSL